MRIATVLAVAAAYGAFANALNQDHLLLRDLSATDTENQSEVTPLSFIAANPYQVIDTSIKCSWGANLVCELNARKNDLKLGSSCDVDVPVPTDNYVGDKRINRIADGHIFPHIEITSTGPKDTSAQPQVQSTGQLAWDGYMNNPSDAQKKINFDAIGVYDTLISAYDYDRAATCDGCIAVRDTYRPQFKDGTCPAAQTSALKLTSTGINKATDYEAKYDAFTNVKNRLNNAESDADCNDESTKLQNFYDASPTSPFTGTCFCQDNVKNNVAKLKQNPFSSAENIKKPGLQLEKDLNDKCTWSCTKSITLKEKYTAYTCPSSASQPPTTCEGLPASTCSMDVSVKATGSDVAQTTVKLTQAVQDASTKLLTELGKPSGTDVANTIHYSLPCTSYDDAGNRPECHYNVKLSDLLDISNTGSGPNAGPKFVTDLPSNSEKVTDYVFWRVKAGSQEWATWNPKNDAEISFKSPETTVTVEAWTACGQITSITVVVKLYLHRSLTCDHFVDMWSPLTAKLYGEDSYCNVEDSDFSLFNLDYNYDDIIPADDGSDLLKGTYKKVKCNIRVRDSSAPEGSVAEDLLVPETNQAAITKNFAVELVHDPTTAPKTVFRVECTFSRDLYDNGNTGNQDTQGAQGNQVNQGNQGNQGTQGTQGNQGNQGTQGNQGNQGNGGNHIMLLTTDTLAVNEITCFHSFTIADCDRPKLEPGVEEEDVCAYDCAGKGMPGAYEACGGTVVSSNGQNTFVKTSAQDQCCADCNPNLSCISFGTTEVKRCEVQSTYSHTALAAAEQTLFASGSTTAMALLGASAMVAVVALVVVKRRASITQETDDAYYPLLE